MKKELEILCDGCIDGDKERARQWQWSCRLFHPANSDPYLKKNMWKKKQTKKKFQFCPILLNFLEFSTSKCTRFHDFNLAFQNFQDGGGVKGGGLCSEIPFRGLDFLIFVPHWVPTPGQYALRWNPWWKPHLLWDQFMTQMKKKVSQCNDQC